MIRNVSNEYNNSVKKRGVEVKKMCLIRLGLARPKHVCGSCRYRPSLIVSAYASKESEFTKLITPEHCVKVGTVKMLSRLAFLTHKKVDRISAEVYSSFFC